MAKKRTKKAESKEKGKQREKKVCFCDCCQERGGEISVFVAQALQLLELIFAHENESDVEEFIYFNAAGITRLLNLIRDDLKRADALYAEVH